MRTAGSKGKATSDRGWGCIGGDGSFVDRLCLGQRIGTCPRCCSYTTATADHRHAPGGYFVKQKL